jgi:hypothetical protein
MLLAAPFLLVAGNAEKVRVAGSNTVSGDIFYVSCDSADTFGVDTVYSDTVTVDTLKDQFLFYVNRANITICDSCNDSTIVAVTLFTQWENGMVFAPWSATMDADTLPDTVSGRLFIGAATSSFSPDSMVGDKVWFETVFSDSVIKDAIIDSTTVRVRIDTRQI